MISFGLIISFVLTHAISLNDYKRICNKVLEIIKETGVNLESSLNIGYEAYCDKIGKCFSIKNIHGFKNKIIYSKIRMLNF